jgi:predicted nucleic acid-binding protein
MMMRAEMAVIGKMMVMVMLVIVNMSVVVSGEVMQEIMHHLERSVAHHEHRVENQQ